MCVVYLLKWVPQSTHAQPEIHSATVSILTYMRHVTGPSGALLSPNSLNVGIRTQMTE